MSCHTTVKSLLGKRKRKKNENPNPLFSKWLSEWRDEAKEKGWKSEFVYSKALRSLQKFPLLLSTGKECKVLQHFGDKICKMLDDRLLKHVPDQAPEASPHTAMAAIPAVSPTKTTEPSWAGPSSKVAVHEISDNSDEEDSRFRRLIMSAAVGKLTVTEPSAVGGSTTAKTASVHAKRLPAMLTTDSYSEASYSSVSDNRLISAAYDRTSKKLNDVMIDEDLDVSIVGHTSPIWLDNCNSPEGNLPDLPPFDVGELPSRTDWEESNDRCEPNQSTFEDWTELDLPRLPDLNVTDGGRSLAKNSKASDGTSNAQAKKNRVSNGRSQAKTPKGNGTSQAKKSRAGDGRSQAKKPAADNPRDVGLAAGAVTPRQRHTIGDEVCHEDRQPGSRTPREYVPVYRSGPYAILLTLFRHAQDPNFRGFLTKVELSHAAQPLADKSFFVPDPGSRYTAWSSMSTLVRKGFLTKEKSPARYRLTDAGHQLAQRLEEAERRGVAQNPGDREVVGAGPPSCHGDRAGERGEAVCGQGDDGWEGDVYQDTASQEGSSGEWQNESGGMVEEEEGVYEDAALWLPSLPSLADRLKPAASTSTSAPTPTLTCTSASTLVSDNRDLRYWYVADGDQLVIRKDQACVSLDAEFGVGFLVKVNYQQLLLSGNQYKLDMARTLGDDFVFAYLADIHCDEVSQPPPDVDSSGNDFNANRAKPIHTLSDSDWEDDQLPAIPTLSATSSSARSLPVPPYPEKISHRKPKSAQTFAPSVNNLAGPEKISHQKPKFTPSLKILADPAGADLGVSSSSAVVSGSGSNPSKGLFDAAGPPSVASYIPSTASSSSQDSTDGVRSVASEMSQGVEDVVLRPGTFDVVLCVDNREFYGSKSSSKSLLPDLIRNGVTCDLRLLNVGDLLWVAREKPVAGAGPGVRGPGEPRPPELVLSYVVERKRMDDFVSSMVGGRMRDQKFRLKHSGLQEKIILIESYGSMQNFSISEDRIQQAIANTEVIDGFTVKLTRDSKETAAYLTLMTRYLHTYYQNKTLRACSQDNLKELGMVCDVNDTEQLLMPFEHFNQACLKNKPLTVQELFAKQLIQLHGMSADKAKAVVDKYRTPSSLIEAYARCCTEKDKDSLLASLKFGKNLRNLGIAVSRQVGQLFSTLTLT